MTETAVPVPSDLARVEPNSRWIRGRRGGQTVVDTTDALLVWEHSYYPQWYIPVADVTGELRPTGVTKQTDNRGRAEILDLVLDDGTVVADAARRHPDSPIDELRDRVRFRWDALDHWFEEEVEVFVHPRSPYTRVDVLPSTRHIVIRIGDTVVADSPRPSILYETGLPARYYLPPDDVRMELLRPTDTSTACPYKGTARYWSAEVDGETHLDVVWGYDDPLPESAGVQGLVCFYDERVDVEIDGVTQHRPVTKFA